MIDVAVIGGGIAGLAAAYELQQQGLHACLLEATDRVGGVVRTERVDGWTIDAGPDALLVQKPAAIELCHELGLAERLIPTQPPRTAYILRHGRLVPIPEGSFLGFPVGAAALARSPLFTWRGKLRMACEVMVPRGGDDDESIASFVRRRFGREALDALAEPLLAGIHAGDAERLSVVSLFPRLREAERRSGSVLRSLRAHRTQPSSGGAFRSLKGGLEELVRAIAAALTPGTIRLSAHITDLQRTAAYDLTWDAGHLEAKAVILATPAYAAGTVLRGLDMTLGTLCDGIQYASTATVAFGFRRGQVRHPLDGSGFVVPRVERSPLLAATWVSSKWEGRAPDGCVLLRAFLGGGRDPHRLERPDEELVSTARAALADVLGLDGEPLLTRLYRYTRQSPQYEVGHIDRVASIERRAAEITGLFITGSGFRAIGIPDCVADGRATARRAAAYLKRAEHGTH